MLIVPLNNLIVEIPDSSLDICKKMVDMTMEYRKEIPAIVFGKRSKERYIIKKIIIPDSINRGGNERNCFLRPEYYNFITEKYGRLIIGSAHTHPENLKEDSLIDNISYSDIIFSYKHGNQLNLTCFSDDKAIIYFTNKKIRNKAKKAYYEYIQEMEFQSGAVHDSWCFEKFEEEIYNLKKTLDIKVLDF